MKVLSIFLSALFPVFMYAEDTFEYSPDRPGCTTGTNVLPQWKVGWETGLAYEHNRRNGSNEKTWTINTSTIRIGVTPHAELRLQMDECTTHSPDGNSHGIANAMIGTKIRIFEGQGWIPQISYLGNLLIPGGRKADYLPSHPGAQMHLLFSNTINRLFSLGYDIGAEWSGESNSPDLFFGACINLMINSKLTLFAESYNYYNGSKQDEWAKPQKASHFNWMSEWGAAYMLSPKLQLDLYTDVNFNEPSKYFNIGIGVAWLIN